MQMVVKYYETRANDTTAVRVRWRGIAVGGEIPSGGYSYQVTLIVVVTDGEAHIVRKEDRDYASHGQKLHFLGVLWPDIAPPRRDRFSSGAR